MTDQGERYDRIAAGYARWWAPVLSPGVIELLDDVAPRLDGYVTTLVDDHTLEVEVSAEENLNDIFARLTALGIEVLSMRNKVNRLEEIFMQLVEGRGAAAEGARGAAAAAPPGAAGATPLRAGAPR